MIETHLPRFSGASHYVLDDELAKIVNVSMALEMPLLLKGEPGTGKTMLAHSIAESLDMPLLVLNVKSSMKLVEALYQYDTLTRLNDSRFGDSSRDVSNIAEYIRMGKIGQAFVADERVVLLIDEIDKADTDFQDDMLDVLDQMEFDILEIDSTVKARHRPVVIISPYRLSRTGDDAPHHCGPLSGSQRRSGPRRHQRFLSPAQHRRNRKETGDQGTAQLDPGSQGGLRFSRRGTVRRAAALLGYPL